MKKVVLMAAICLLGMLDVTAQEIKFGAKLGVNFANVTGDNTKDLDPVTAFSFGVVAEKALSASFSIQPELHFSGKGYSVGEDVVALNYLTLPLMAKYYITKGFSLEAGPQLGYLLTAKQEDTDVKDSFNKVDFGANIGLGYTLNNGLNFGVRYNKGLSDINKIDGLNAKNSIDAVQFSIGYFF